MKRFFALVFAPLALAALLGATAVPPAHAEESAASQNPFPEQQTFGSFDKSQLQRGFLVYQTVCASCHSLNALHYRDLAALGLDADQVAALAAHVTINDRAATPDDRFRNPFPNPAKAEAAFGGAIPPDLSTIANARPGGPRYIFALLTGYQQAPSGFTVVAGHYFNLAYPGNRIAMPPPLKDNQVSYADGTKASAAQEAADVSAFLDWAANPDLDARKQIGLRAVLFLVFLGGLAVATKRRTWTDI
jgi:ubiquinol-cytochrome c reductase cytochrome c1 subunit